MANHPVATHLGNEIPAVAHSINPNVPPFDVPDPEPGWATCHPDRALAFLYVSPRPCSAIDELIRL